MKLSLQGFAAAAAIMLTAGLTSLTPGIPATAADSTAPKNLALTSNGAVATASGAELSKWGADKATDGVRDLLPDGEQSRWSSNYSDTAWLQVKLAAPATVHHVTLHWEAACAAEYKIQVSTDGSAWSDASGVLVGNCAGTDRVPLANTGEIGYIRMQGLKRTAVDGKFWGMSLWEFEAWSGPEPQEQKPLGLVPLPASVTAIGGTGFTLRPSTRVLTHPDFAGAAEQLADRFRTSTGYPIPVVEGDTAVATDVVLKLDSTIRPDNAEAYRLSATERGILAEAATPHGAFNATQTIRQLFPAGIESPTPVRANWSTPALTVEDAPRFGYRGIMLDVARSFLTVDEVKRIIDRIAAHKMNRLHLHLADDQGWRIEITNDGRTAGDTIDYTRLTTVSGATAMTQQGYLQEPGRTGYYTQADYTELVRYAADRFIQVVPEIDLPGHTNSALAAIPELNTAGSSHPATPTQPTAPPNGTGDVGYSYLDPGNEATFTFITHVMRQLSALTPGELIHVGGDEAHAMVNRHGASQFNSFVARVLDIVHDAGKKVSGWNEIARTLSAIRSGDHVQYWDGSTADLPPAAEKGARIVASRGASSYLDMKYNAKTPIGLSWACGGTCDLVQYYSWDPAQLVVGLAEDRIAGPEAPLWTETVRGVGQAEFMIFPRALAHAEIGWTPQARRNIADFTQRVGAVGARFIASGTNFYDTPQAKWLAQGVGHDVNAEAGTEGAFTVATIYAPGTTLDATGRILSIDAVDDADGVSLSDLRSVSATIEWGDGNSSPARFSTEKPRGVLGAAGAYTVSGSRSFAAAGVHQGRVVGSDGRTFAEFTVTVLPSGGLLVPVWVDGRCVAGKVVLAVVAANGEGVPVAVTFTSSYGTKSFAGVVAGKNAFHAFSTRLAGIPAGEVRVSVSAVVAGEAVSFEQVIAYPARSC